MAGVAFSTVGDRHALHSVYYRAMKKTLTALNDVYMRNARHLDRARYAAILRRDVALNA
jgi:hypothetical protein